MKIATVYQKNESDFFTPASEEDLENIDRDFTKVAEVVVEVYNDDTRSLEEAYKLTNHLDKEWWKNEEVTMISQSRSTSVGDIIEMDGMFYAVDICGFKLINK